jgi:hypothetical protein
VEKTSQGKEKKKKKKKKGLGVLADGQTCGYFGI